MRRSQNIGLLWLLGIVAGTVSLEAGERLNAAKLLPKTTIVYAEVPTPKIVVNLVLQHPLRKRVEALPDVQAALKSKDAAGAKLALGLFETQMGMEWPDAVGALTDGGLFVAVDAATEGGVLLAKADDIKTLIKLRDLLFQMARGEAKDGEEAVQKKKYRNVSTYDLNDVTIAAIDTTLVVSNKRQLVEKIVDQHQDSGNETLADTQQFRDALRKRNASATAWAYANVGPLRDDENLKALYSGKTENIVAEILIGGILSNLQHTPYATAEVTLTSEQIHVSTAMPHDNEWVGESREYFFGPEGKGQSLTPVELKNTIFTATTHRDLSQMWLRAGDLMTEKANDELAQADTTLSTIFAGKDFAEDILADLKPEMQLVVVQQDFNDVMPRPAMKLPAFAMIFQMKDQATTQPEFRRVFQSLVGFFNVVGAMEGNPQLDLGSSEDGDIKLYTGSYVPEAGEETSTSAKLHYNFSPTVAFHGDWFVVSSTKSLALEIAKKVGDKPPALSDDNTSARLDAVGLHRVLADNRELLVAQNMLEEGHSKAEAKAAVGLALEIVKVFRDMSFKLRATDGELRMDTRLKLADFD